MEHEERGRGLQMEESPRDNHWEGHKGRGGDEQGGEGGGRVKAAGAWPRSPSTSG